ncbi:hypothetical protein LIER_21724 [Lithospermum erythrorhizon]|uniref:Reverse transcriptase Ty1/copia-type domain-containing protein n=1 Tax=Lithospermum erythrorhizon TaxID=34254 RepID=A0AAV3QRE7_LITER
MVGLFGKPYFISKEEPKDVKATLLDEHWINAMYTQIEGVDFEETLAPVARLEAIRLLLALACLLKFKLYQMNVKSAFLNGNTEDRKSTSGGCFLLGNNLVSWFSKKQNYVSLSTVEAEYCDAGSSCIQLLWMKQMIEEYGVKQGKGDQIQPKHSDVGGKGNTQVPPSVDNTRKGSTDTLIKSVEDGDKADIPISRVDIDVSLNCPDKDNVGDDKEDVPEKISEDVEGVNPSVKDTSDDTSYKSVKTHSFVHPTMAELLASMKATKLGNVRGGRIKRSLRKQGVPVRHVKGSHLV